MNEPIYGGSAVITGRFTEKEARDLASALENPLRVPVEVEETRSVSPTLGTDSIRSGILAGLTGLVLVFAFVIVYYRFAGVVAFMGLLVNMVILFGAMAMFNFVLTLPGIAGVILTMGMAVDANVLIYERLREETRRQVAASCARSGLRQGLQRDLRRQRHDPDHGVILFWQATGSVKGFAVTLTFGIVASMFSALLVTRTVFRWLIERFGLKKLTMLDLIPKRKFDFLGKRRHCRPHFGRVIGGSIAILPFAGRRNLASTFVAGICWCGFQTACHHRRSARDARRHRPGGCRHSVRARRHARPALDSQPARHFCQDPLQSSGNVSRSRRHRGVPGKRRAANRLGVRKRAALALALGMIGILIYVTFRFEFSFALGALLPFFTT